MTQGFQFREAFGRTIGWVDEGELELLGQKRVAIAGLGGVGGSHLLTLARLGIGAFTVADPDHFDLANLNRQAGAFVSTLGRRKVDVLAHMARDINPALHLRTMGEGVEPDSIPDFLEGADIFVDGLDFFSLSIRRQVFAACHDRGIPAVTAAPLGMGTAVLTFLPGETSFEDYFRLEGQPAEEQLLRFLLGLAPAGLHRPSLVDPRAIQLEARRGPSTPMGCELCAGAAASEVLKLLLGRGRVRAAPRGMQFDAYRNRTARTWRPGGNGHPLQRLSLKVARRQFQRTASRSPLHSVESDHAEPLERILDLARWAPSGDNTQPWRFEPQSPDRVTVHLQPPEGEDPYDYAGRGTWLAGGTLLESLRIAAAHHGRSMHWELGNSALPARIEVELAEDETLAPEPLADYLGSRSVRREPYRLRPLSSLHKELLRASLGGKLEVHWAESLPERWQWTAINAAASGIRLGIPETFAVHRRVLDWDHRFSKEKVPVQSLGLDPLTRRLMGWALGEWERVRFLNRYLSGKLLPRLEMDWAPGLACGAHFWLVADAVEGEDGSPTPVGILEAGMALQRFWLTAERLGLALQPAYAPLAFAHYARNGEAFTQSAWARNKADHLADRLARAVAPADPQRVVFAGRIGLPRHPAPGSRSVRKPLEELLLPTAG
ncbi:ThiF family adenylyltransferase [Thiohalorhabdus sp.]|uniref:ThiF family adenylyltransferase n=1 Tax=Thiohalorhabdus sp. TaxID=3094134 RepID=UPI002FC35F6A